MFGLHARTWSMSNDPLKMPIVVLLSPCSLQSLPFDLISHRFFSYSLIYTINHRSCCPGQAFFPARSNIRRRTPHLDVRCHLEPTTSYATTLLTVSFFYTSGGFSSTTRSQRRYKVWPYLHLEHLSQEVVSSSPRWDVFLDIPTLYSLREEVIPLQRNEHDIHVGH